VIAPDAADGSDQDVPCKSRHVLPAMSVAGLSRRYRVMPGGIRRAAGRVYLGWLVPTLYRCRALA